MFNLTVTRFLQVLAMKNIHNRPTLLESWLMSAILKSFGKRIGELKDDFLTQSNQRIPSTLRKKFDAKVSAEIREDEAIKKFKHIQLTQSRINELKINESRRNLTPSRGHTRASSNVDLYSLKIERDNKRILDKIKSDCGFLEMKKDFAIFIEKNQKTWLHANQKNTKSTILIFLKKAVLEYQIIQDDTNDPLREKIKFILEKLDMQINAEHEVKKKRRTTAYDKNIKFIVTENNSVDDKKSSATTAVSSTSISSTSSNADTSEFMLLPTTTDFLLEIINSTSSKEGQKIQSGSETTEKITEKN